MQQWRGLDDVPAGWGRCVVTIGVFDGVHRGHQRIIGRAVERARELALPLRGGDVRPAPLRGGAARQPSGGPHAPSGTGPHCMAELGVDALCVIPFTIEFSRLGPDEFVHEVLVGRLHVAAVVVGARTSASATRRPVTSRRWPSSGSSLRVHGRRRRPRRRGTTRRTRRPTCAPASPRATWSRPPTRWAGRTASRASWCAVTSAAASSATRRPTWRLRRTRPSPPTASTPAGCSAAQATLARRDLGRDEPDVRRRRTGGSRRTCWTGTTSTCTASTSPSTSGRGCATTLTLRLGRRPGRPDGPRRASRPSGADRLSGRRRPRLVALDAVGRSADVCLPARVDQHRSAAHRTT